MPEDTTSPAVILGMSRSTIRKAGSSTAQGPDGLRAPPLPSRGTQPGLPDGALQPLSCRSRYSGNLKELHRNHNFEGREASKPGSLISPHLAALPSSENTRAAPPSLYHRGAGHTPLFSQLQIEPLHRLGHAPISARVVSGFNQC